MLREFDYTITAADSGRTIEQFLKRRGYSKHVIIHVRNTGGITLNGGFAITPQRLSEQDLLHIRLEETESSENIVSNPALPFPIVYEDQDLMILNKPANMPIHPSQGNFENTLANAAAWYFEKQQEPFVYRVINRLDRDTTGLLILAKNALSACILSRMSADREIHREYLAIAKGLVEASGTIDAPIGRAENSTVLRCIDFADGERSVTHFTRVLYRPDLDVSLVRLTLETGRTHQIRVHMGYIQHPLPGDFLYNPDYKLIGRQALHSHSLDFVHPLTGEALHFEAPLPDDMRFILEF